MAKPDLLILDEPSMGLAPIVVEEIYGFLRHRTGTLARTAILLGEQSTALALSVAERAYVLNRGNVVFDGLARELDESTMLSEYLGAAPGA
jgi:branched-chain amino acid transport system ATP-binding protein